MTLLGQAAGDVLSAAGRGALAGAAAATVGTIASLVTKNPTAIGAASGATYSLINQKLGPQGRVDLARLAIDTGIGAALGPFAEKLLSKIRGPEPNIYRNRDLFSAGPKTQRVLKANLLGGYFGFLEALFEQGLKK